MLHIGKEGQNLVWVILLSNHLSKRSHRDITVQTVIFTGLCSDNKGLKENFVVWDKNKF